MGDLDGLRTRLRQLGRVVVAFSGGADSAFLAWVAHDTLGPDGATALSMQVTPPGNTSGLSMPLSEGSRPAFCGAGDPGSTLAISPVEPNARATFAF